MDINFKNKKIIRNLKSQRSTSLRERGFTLLYASLVGALLLAIASGIFSIIFKELILTSSSRESFTAFYAADSGLECALYWDFNQSLFATSSASNPNTSGVSCAGSNFTNTWTVVGDGNSALTNFSLTFAPNDYCSDVSVSKADGLTTIESRGYNTCDTNNPRRVERAIRATFSEGISVVYSEPVVTLTASPTSVSYGGSSTLTWTVTDATSCTASGNWSGSKDVNGGNQTFSNLVSNRIYTLSCSGLGGTGQDSVTVVVGDPPAPTVTLSASPTSVEYGGSSTLTWTSTNASSCTATAGPGFSTSGSTSGSDGSSSLTSNSTFTVSCTGTGGTTNKSVTVSVLNRDTLYSGQYLVPGNSTASKLTSPNGSRFLVYQGDGNFVAYRVGVGPYWATGTNPSNPYRVVMQGDCNLVVYASGSNPLWSTGTGGSGSGCYTKIYNDGSIKLHRSNGTVLQQIYP